MRYCASRNRDDTRSSPTMRYGLLGSSPVIRSLALALFAFLASLAVPAAARASADGDAPTSADPALLLGVLAAPVAARRSPQEEAVSAGVPAALARDVAARAAERGLDVAAALEPVVAAARGGLPAELVGAKILEGLAKGAPAERVLAVARALLERLATARAILDEAGAAGLALRADRTAALADLAGAIAEGVGPGSIAALLAASQRAGGGADPAVAAARTVGALAHRGVPVPDALPLGEALAARPPLPAGEVAGLYDAYRAEGGRDPRAFVEEATRRTRSGAPLTGMVDWFGDTGDKVVRQDRPESANAAGATGPGSARGRASGTPPGLEDRPRGRGKSKPK